MLKDEAQAKKNGFLIKKKVHFRHIEDKIYVDRKLLQRKSFTVSLI